MELKSTEQELWGIRGFYIRYLDMKEDYQPQSFNVKWEH